MNPGQLRARKAHLHAEEPKAFGGVVLSIKSPNKWISETWKRKEILYFS